MKIEHILIYNLTKLKDIYFFIPNYQNNSEFIEFF